MFNLSVSQVTHTILWCLQGVSWDSASEKQTEIYFTVQNHLFYDCPYPIKKIELKNFIETVHKVSYWHSNQILSTVMLFYLSV